MTESKERKQTAEKKHQDCLCLWDQQKVTTLYRTYPKLAMKHRSSSKTQLDMPGDLFSDGFADEAVLCGEDTAFQLSRGGGVILLQPINRELSNRNQIWEIKEIPPPRLV